MCNNIQRISKTLRPHRLQLARSVRSISSSLDWKRAANKSKEICFQDKIHVNQWQTLYLIYITGYSISVEDRKLTAPTWNVKYLYFMYKKCWNSTESTSCFTLQFALSLHCLLFCLFVFFLKTPTSDDITLHSTHWKWQAKGDTGKCWWWRVKELNLAQGLYIMRSNSYFQKSGRWLQKAHLFSFSLINYPDLIMYRHWPAKQAQFS